MADLSTFSEYEREFQSISSGLSSRISRVMTYSSDSDANADLRKIEVDLASARQRLTDMEMEARGLPEATRKELGSKIRVYKDSLTSVTSDLKRAREKFSRSALMAGGGGGGAAGSPSGPLTFDKSLEARGRMDAAATKMRGGLDTLHDTRRELEATVEVGEGTLEELGRHRERLTAIHGKVGTVGSALDEARRILRSMGRREMRTRLCLGVFAVVLVGIIIGVIVWIVKSRQNQG